MSLTAHFTNVDMQLHRQIRLIYKLSEIVVMQTLVLLHSLNTTVRATCAISNKDVIDPVILEPDANSPGRCLRDF